MGALDQQCERLKALSSPVDEPWLSSMSDADLISFRSRQLLFGAQPALEWVMNKYRPAEPPGL